MRLKQEYGKMTETSSHCIFPPSICITLCVSVHVCVYILQFRPSCHQTWWQVPQPAESFPPPLCISRMLGQVPDIISTDSTLDWHISCACLQGSLCCGNPCIEYALRKSILLLATLTQTSKNRYSILRLAFPRCFSLEPQVQIHCR